MNTPWRDKCRVPDVNIRKVIPTEVFAEKLMIKRILEAKRILDARGDGRNKN